MSGCEGIGAVRVLLAVYSVVNAVVVDVNADDFLRVQRRAWLDCNGDVAAMKVGYRTVGSNQLQLNLMDIRVALNGFYKQLNGSGCSGLRRQRVNSVFV